MENQKSIIDIANEAENQAGIKEPVNKISNTELNNNICLDLIVKTSKLQQILNVLLDFNNTAELDIVISPEEFKQLQEQITQLFISLKAIVGKFSENYELKRKDNHDLKLNESTESSDLLQSKENN